MIIFPEIGRHGRLGNQMFQLATMKALALETNTECYLPNDLDEREHHGQKCLLNHFDHKLPVDSEGIYNNFTGTYFLDGVRDSVNQNFFSLSGDIALHGQYESEEYFIKYKDKVKKLFELKEPLETKTKEYIEDIKNRFPKSEIVAVHFRRGDAHINVENPTPFFEFVENVKKTYFCDKHYVFLIFTGGSRDAGNSNQNDMLFLKATLGGDSNTIFCEENNTILEFGIMSKCDHMIMTSGSTFTWWAGYINKNPNKKIVVPKHRMGHLFYPEVLWPGEFIKFG